MIILMLDNNYIKIIIEWIYVFDIFYEEWLKNVYI
jgi:hypothetical protein